MVSAHPGVNHNYEREHHYNLWFVMTGRDAVAVEEAMRSLESATGLIALRLPMVRPYRIDLSFDLRGESATAPVRRTTGGEARTLTGPDLALAALVEAGLPLVARPYDVWAAELGRDTPWVLRRLDEWLRTGVMRRFGNIVRHHELGFAANAMTVFDVPADGVDTLGQALAAEHGVTLAYQRQRAEGWPYNLYCMVHGRDRDTVREALARIMARTGLGAYPHAVLFSTRRFKQTGARRFRALPETQGAGAC